MTTTRAKWSAAKLDVLLSDITRSVTEHQKHEAQTRTPAEISELTGYWMTRLEACRVARRTAGRRGNA